MPATTQPEKLWTFMVYMAGDNKDMDRAGGPDLKEMKQVGSSPEVNVIAQFDRAEGAKRYYLRKGGNIDQDVVKGFSEKINSGDPKDLYAFIKWGVENYPAKHYALVLWGHGQGWDDTDLWDDVSRRGFSEQGSQRLHQTTFRTSAGRALQEASHDQDLEAILRDDSSKDFLNNLEMKQVLADTAALLKNKQGKNKLDLLGMDACLMSMIEVGYEMRESVKFTVGSEQIEPGEGWPYDRILNRLVKNAKMTARDLVQ